MALYMNGQEISQSSGVPIAVEGLTEVNVGTPSNIQGLVKGDGSTLQAAQAGTDYQTPLTADVDYATPATVVNKQNKITAQGLLKGLGDGDVTKAIPGVDYPVLPEKETQIWYWRDSFFLEDNKIYNLTYVFDSNAFQVNGAIYAPDTWAHGTFYTNCYYLNAGIILDGLETRFNPPQFIGGSPTIKSNTYYEFDVFNNVWAIQEIISE